MKKFLIFMLVLGLVSTASAQLTALAPVVTGNVSWNIQGAIGFEQLIGYNLTGVPSPAAAGYGIDQGNSGVGPAIVAAIGVAGGTFANSYDNSLLAPPAVPPAYNAGGGGRVFGPAITGWAGYDAFDGAVPGFPTVAATNWFKFNLLAGAKNGDTIDLYNYATSMVVPAGTMHIIPEPMTIMLLGLGSLLLRRRK